MVGQIFDVTFYCLLITLINVCTSQLHTSKEVDQIVLAQVLYRHGERTPNKLCKTDEFDADTWNVGLGELTSTGVEQQFALGRRFRRRYVEQLGLISPNYNSKEIYVRSSDVNRTLVSAMANAAGFYATTDEDGKVPAFAPVPVHTVKSSHDFLRPDRHCVSRQRLLLKLLKETPQYHQMLHEHKAMLKSVSQLCGIQVGFFQGEAPMCASILATNARIFEATNVKSPKWFTHDLISKIENLTAAEAAWKNGFNTPKVFRHIFLAQELTRARGGRVLWSLIDTMRAKRDCLLAGPMECRGWSRDRRFIHYSAHDTTFAALLPALGLPTNVDRPGYVPFSSALLVELWQKGNESNANTNSSLSNSTSSETKIIDAKNDPFYVKILFWPGATLLHEHRPFEMDLSNLVTGCGINGCSLHQFMKRSEPLIPIPTNDKLCGDPTDIQTKMEVVE